MKKKKYYCLYPSGLNLDKILMNYPPDFNFNKDYLFWLISEVSTKLTYKMKEDDQDCWVRLCSSIMKYHPYSYNEHLKYLINEEANGGILWGKKYSKGKCFSYRLADKYFMNTLNVHEITDFKLLKYINKTRNQQVVSNNKFKKKYNFLAKYFESGQLKIDVNGALGENHNLFKSNPNPVEGLLKQRLNAIHITKISNENYSLTYSYKTDGRIHSLITNLNKDLRKYITYGDKKLAEVDVKSSVPTFFYYIIKELYNDRKNPDLIKILSNISGYHHMCEKRLKSIDIASIESFGSQILNGTFYESFYGDYKKNDSELELRKEVKKDILAMMFAGNSSFIKIFKKYSENITLIY